MSFTGTKTQRLNQHVHRTTNPGTGVAPRFHPMSQFTGDLHSQSLTKTKQTFQVAGPLHTLSITQHPHIHTQRNPGKALNTSRRCRHRRACRLCLDGITGDGITGGRSAGVDQGVGEVQELVYVSTNPQIP